MTMHHSSTQSQATLPARHGRITVVFRSPQPHEHALVAVMSHVILLESGRDRAYPFGHVLQGILADMKRLGSQYVLACVHGQIAGKMKLRREFHDLHNGDVMFIEHVYICRPFRGNGIYRQLHDYAVTTAQNEGLKEVRLHVATDNDRAARAYEKQGTGATALLMTQSVDSAAEDAQW